MAPRLPSLLLATCLLGACAPAAAERAVALRLAVENSRTSLGTASLGTSSLGITIPIAPTLVTDPPRQALAAEQRLASLTETAHAAIGPVTGLATGPAAAAQLLGARPETLRRWLGEPSLRRAEGTAEVWLYAGAACALDLIFYPEAGRLRVAHASARANGAEPRTEAHCLQDLAAGPDVPPAPPRPAPPKPTADRGA